MRFQNSIIAQLASKLGTAFDVNDEKTFADNLGKINIFYKSFTYEDISESPGYPVGGARVPIIGSLMI